MRDKGLVPHAARSRRRQLRDLRPRRRAHGCSTRGCAGLSRIELRDLALHAAAIAGTAAEVAADRASDDDLETLQAIARAAPT